MATDNHEVAASVYGVSARNRNLYLARLREQGLPTKPPEQSESRPRQFQLAQLAAIIGKQSEERQSCVDLAAQALQIWLAAGKVLWVEDQLNLVNRGLLFFDRDDWWRHAGALVDAFDDAKGGIPGYSATGGVDEFVIAGQKAGSAVCEVWERGLVHGGNEAALRALFPGKGETERSRSKKLIGLIAYINNFLREETRQRRDYYAKEKTDALTAWLEGVWTPLAFNSNASRDHIIKLTRERFANPESFLKPMALTAFPQVARFLVVMRQRNASESKVRRQ